MNLPFLSTIKTKIWLAIILCIIPILIYFLVFRTIALNVNYVAFDDILILGIIDGFSTNTLTEKWQRLTELFPEHRLLFSRSIILLVHSLVGKINLVWLMIIANCCWAACIAVFYKAFTRLQLSLWYFIPISWIWFNIQSFENMFWGVSSLCNFGVLFFAIGAIYICVYYPKNIARTLIAAIAATFTYGNGIIVFPVIGLICLVTKRKRHFLISMSVFLVIAFIYFTNFTPITQNLDLSNPKQVMEGFFGVFGFIGSISTLSAYGLPISKLIIAVITGIVSFITFLFLFKNQWIPLGRSFIGQTYYQNPTALFALAIAIFTGMTTLALTYKRIPTDTFEGMFKGRYRMYSTLWCISLYFSWLSLSPNQIRRPALSILTFLTIGLNLIILHSNFAYAVNNRRQAIAQEFNARYNADWLGTKMFTMKREHLEKIRAYYNSEDPLSEGWIPDARSTTLPCVSLVIPDTIIQNNDQIFIRFDNYVVKTRKNYSDGAYIILKSIDHVYISPPNQTVVPLKTTLRRQIYFSKGIYGNFHQDTIEPGLYNIYLLVRYNGENKIYCTGKTLKED